MNTLLLTIGCLCLVALGATASPLTWNLQDVTFNVNGVETFITGSFGYDFNTGKYSSLNMGSTTTGAFINAVALPASGGNMLEIVSGAGDLTGDLEMLLNFKKTFMPRWLALQSPLMALATAPAQIAPAAVTLSVSEMERVWAL